MLVIVISIIIGLGLVFLGVAINEVGLYLIGIFVAAAGVMLALFSATDYKEWELEKETELVSLSNSTATEGGGFIYVSVSGENVYTYRYKISSEFGTNTSTEYETNAVSGNVIESEDPNCKVPVLLKYKRKAKVTMWTLGFGASETKYVFYVPEGTIQKEIKLK